MSAITPQILVTDFSKGTTVLRDMTPDELMQLNEDHSANDAKKIADNEALAAKLAAREAVLAKLGLTADEAQALLS
jgi:hypothetical protein